MIAYQNNMHNLMTDSSLYSSEYIAGSFLDSVEEISPPPIPEMFLDEQQGVNPSDIDYNENMLLLDSNGLSDASTLDDFLKSTQYSSKYVDEELLSNSNDNSSSELNYGRLPSGVYQCNYPKCKGKGFLSLKDLKNHMHVTHSGRPASNKAKPFKCDLCPQTFSRSHGKCFIEL